jgi:hypothetical protein
MGGISIGRPILFDPLGSSQHRQYGTNLSLRSTPRAKRRCAIGCRVETIRGIGNRCTGRLHARRKVEAVHHFSYSQTAHADWLNLTLTFTFCEVWLPLGLSLAIEKPLASPSAKVRLQSWEKRELEFLIRITNVHQYFMLY